MNPKKTRSLIAVLAVVLALLVGGALLFAYQSRSRDDSTATNSGGQQNGGQNAAAEDSFSADDFQLYESSDKKYTFRYPKQWENNASKLNEITTAFVAPKNEEFPNVHVWAVDPVISKCGQTSEPLTDVTVDGIQSKQFTESLEATKNKITCVEKDGLLYHITHAYTDKENTQVYAEVLNSFKFQ